MYILFHMQLSHKHQQYKSEVKFCMYLVCVLFQLLFFALCHY